VSTLRRSVLLVAFALATVLGLNVSPAQAAFDDRAALPTATIGTVTVAAPTNIKVSSSCTTYDLDVTVSWKSSTTPGISGYTITAYTSTGQVLETFTTSPSTTSYSVSAPRTYAAYGIRVSITSQTSYGWTKESAKSGAITC